MKAALFTGAFLILITSPRIALACSCLGSPSVCGAFGAAEGVFVGAVERVQNEVAKSEDGREFVTSQIAHVQVLEAFKGIKDVEVVFRSYGTSCDAHYEVGQRWLFYASYDKKSNSWSVGGCGRSSWAESAADDLLYLRGLPTSAQKTRLAGTLRNALRQPMMGIRVKLSGEQQTYEVFTDKNGVYQFYGLSPGKYSVNPEIPPNVKIKYAFRTGTTSNIIDFLKNQHLILLKENSCAGIDFSFSENTIITGKVFGANGNAMRDVCVRLLLKANPSENQFLSDCTDENGQFRIDEVPIGEYLLVANHDGRVTSREPFRAVYYPGFFETHKATALVFASGSKLEDFDIHIPSQQRTRTIQGLLLFSDGRPASRETIYFRAEGAADGQDGDAHAVSDARGRFSLPILEGTKGTLYGDMFTYVGEFEKCPQLDKLIKAKGNNESLTVETNKIKLIANRDMVDLELIFPFPYCAKSKDPELAHSITPQNIATFEENIYD